MLIRKNKLSRFIMFVSKSTFASLESTPEPFKAHDESSKLTLSYTDINKLLNRYVIDLGMSDRKKSSKRIANHGTRLKEKRNRYTVLEANRFYFEAFKEQNSEKHIFKKIRHSLESVPNELQLHYLNKKEQLAYWLNLYNIGLLKEIVAIYPKKILKRSLLGDDKILSKKKFTVAGIKLSLNGIQYKIVYEKFKHMPKVMYGFYQGYIGSPRITKQAYTGKNVYARDDINERIKNTDEINASINDWSITDIYATMRNFWCRYRTWFTFCNGRCWIRYCY